MKIVAKFLFVILLSISSSSIFASPAYTKSLKANYPGQSVILANYTQYGYTAYATYQGTGVSYVHALGTYPYDQIEYPINYPDYGVCIDVVQNYTGYLAFSGCRAAGIIPIY